MARISVRLSLEAAGGRDITKLCGAVLGDSRTVLRSHRRTRLSDASDGQGTRYRRHCRGSLLLQHDAGTTIALGDDSGESGERVERSRVNRV